MLSGTVWPAHPKPLKDELLSSWICRIAQDNGHHLQTFCHKNWPGLQIWTRDIDTLAPKKLIRSLSVKTGTKISIAEQTTLRSYENILYEKVRITGPNPWVNRIGVYHRTRQRPGLQWCSLCLQQDKHPYYRKEWRLAVTSACLSHGTILSCMCSQCGAPASIHKTNDHTCHVCKHSRLSETPAQANSYALQFEGRLRSQFSKTDVYWRPWSEMHQILLFRTMHILLTILIVGPRSKSLRNKVSRMYNAPIEGPAFLNGEKVLEALSTCERHILFEQAYSLIEGWPWNFIASCQDAEMYWTWVLRDHKQREVPFELYSIMRHFLQASSEQKGQLSLKSRMS